MHKLISLAIIAVALAGCPQVKATEGDVIACAKAEEAAVSKGLSILVVAADVAAAIGVISAGGVDAIPAAIEPLIAKSGEPIVACAINTVAPGVGPALGSAGHADLAPTPRALVLAHYGWRFSK